MVYGDGKLLYSSPEMARGVMPIDFDIDVEGVMRLKIEFVLNEKCILMMNSIL